MELLWKAQDNLPEIKQVIEVFSIVKVELIRDEDMIKVETKLVKPVWFSFNWIMLVKIILTTFNLT